MKKEIYACGTLIETKLGNIEAIITGVVIRFEKIEYEISYFSNADHKSFWVNEGEFTVKNKKQLKIGYKNETK